jgi:putative sigma-54 modulation protein
MDVTQPLRDYVEEKLERIERHLENVASARIVLHVEKERHQAEATISTDGSMLHAHAEADSDMYAAIDALADKLDKQVRRQKAKNTDHRDRGALKNLA